jgi:hypothetical protein
MIALGIAVAVLVNLVLPIAAALWFSRWNARAASNPSIERGFWIGTGIYLGALTFSALIAIVRVYSFDPIPVFFHSIVTLPLSVVPAVFDSNVIHVLITRSEWADLGYAVVMPVYLLGCVAWASLGPILIRAAVHHRRARRRWVVAAP